MDHSLLTNLLKFVVDIVNTVMKIVATVKKNPILVNEICKLSNIGISTNNKSLISNWLNGLDIFLLKICMQILNK